MISHVLFLRLGIQFLRSPTMVHPDHFDMNALLAYAVANNREDELSKSCMAWEKLKSGFWKAQQLSHNYVKGVAVDLTRHENDESGDIGYTVTLADGTEITSSYVVLALGPIGTPIMPSKICNVPKGQLISWKRMQKDIQPHHVVGGGLTAVQSAQYCLRQGKKVYICSRRPLVERHFDIDTCWFDRRSANRLILR